MSVLRGTQVPKPQALHLSLLQRAGESALSRGPATSLGRLCKPQCLLCESQYCRLCRGAAVTIPERRNVVLCTVPSAEVTGSGDGCHSPAPLSICPETWRAALFTWLSVSGTE